MIENARQWGGNTRVPIDLNSQHRTFRLDTEKKGVANLGSEKQQAVAEGNRNKMPDKERHIEEKKNGGREGNQKSWQLDSRVLFFKRNECWGGTLQEETRGTVRRSGRKARDQV